MSGLIGKKLGMTRIFDERGNSIPVTVIEAGPCFVTEVRTPDRHGYRAVQLGFLEKKQKQVNRPEAGHFAKANVAPQQHLKEFKLTDNSQDYQVGTALTVELFQPGDVVKVFGRSKGKGFQGVVKRHNFGGGSITHGQSDRVRAPGSIGSSSYPSRVFKGMKMAGQTGNRRVTVRNLQVVRIVPEMNVLMIRGAVPGARNGIVYISR